MFFSSTWSALEKLIDESRACICREVLEETKRGTDDLYKWAKEYRDFVCSTTDDEIQIASQISANQADWVREVTNAADPFLIAHAKVSGRIIVTEERRAGRGVVNKNQKVPIEPFRRKPRQFR